MNLTIKERNFIFLGIDLCYLIGSILLTLLKGINFFPYVMLGAILVIIMCVVINGSE